MGRHVQSLCGSAAAALTAAVAQLSPDMQLVRDRLLTSYAITVNLTGADADVSAYLPLLAPPGKWSDLNYTVGVATGWGGYDHCTRMAEMGSVYVSPSSTHFQSPAVSTALLGPAGALTWYLQAQPDDTANWWYSMIGCGRPLAQLSLQFWSNLTAEGQANATALMDRAQWISYTSTGTNAADIAVVHIGNGLVNNNASYVGEAFAKIWSTMAYSYGPPPVSPEGPKPDGSFMQHGAQLYNGNYGASWTKDSLSSLTFASGTAFNASPTAYAVVTHVTLDGCAKMIHFPSAQWDPAVIGRQITNPGGQSVMGEGGDAGLLDPAVLRGAGGARGAELTALAAALEAPGNVTMPADFTVFPCSDYAVQRRPEYFASVRMISTKTAGGECINAQGLQSLHSADGAQYVMKTGHEYDSIAPTWDWEALPGTTVQRGGTVLNCSHADGMGGGTFTGGVSANNLTGVAYMALNASSYGQHLTGRKAYFFLDGFLLNLGAGITSVEGYRVTTTLDSRLLDGGGVVASFDAGGSFKLMEEGNTTLPPAASPLLLHHQEMGFAVLGAPTSTPPVTLLNTPVTGSWSSVGTYPGGEVTNPMFTLGMEHGFPLVSNATYAYGMWPAVSRPAFVAGGWKDALARYTVTANTPSVQAVYDERNNTLYAVLYEGNGTSLALPPALRAGWVTPSFPVGLVVSLYTNASTGGDVLTMTFAASGDILSSSGGGGGVGHTYPFFWLTGGSFLPCSWPHCPLQWAEPKGYVGPPGLKFDCFANGTVFFTNPPSQVDAGGGVVPPIACAFA